MIHQAQSANSTSLILVEACLTLIAVVACVSIPPSFLHILSPLRRAWNSLASRKALSIVVVGGAMLLGRIAILPWFPAPLPLFNDDFSYLLQADTFVHGRLANPTPVMWTHFETDHVSMFPKYASMYFPGPALVMAAGKVLFGHPWAGILLSCALMCAALCWALQAWLPPGWALLGGFLVILRIGMFSYWANSYTGGATVSALGGALVLGAMPRLMKTARFRYAMLMAIGMVLLALTRPWEGVLICVPVVVALGFWIARSKTRPPLATLARRAALPIALLISAVAWMGYYDTQAFGKATILPYKIARADYAVVPYYIWQPPNKVPVYRHDEMRRFYTVNEMSGYSKLRTWRGFVPQSVAKVHTVMLFMIGFALAPPLFMLRRSLRDRRMRFIRLCLPFWIVGLGIGVFLNPHYVAPFLVAFYIVGLQCMRHLNQWRVGDRRAGAVLVHMLVFSCVFMGGLRLVAEPLHMTPPAWPLGSWISTWIGPTHYGQERAAIADELDRVPGKHLVLVRYTTAHEPCDEWVYNGADIDGSKTIWAHDMSQSENRELMEYYKDRDVWLVQPDLEQGRLTAYSVSSGVQAQFAASR